MFSTLFKTKQQTKFSTIKPAELNDRLRAGEDLTLIDVRSADEYGRDGHIAGSRLMPLQTLNSRMGELENDKPIVCVCRSGARSQVACEALAAQGFTNVINLSGGMMMWRLSGLPTH